MDDLSIEMETLRKKQIEILETQNAVREMRSFLCINSVELLQQNITNQMA